jgi:hypothetical protein
MTVGAGIVLGPQRKTAMIIAGESSGLLVAIERPSGKHHPGEGELSGIARIRWKRDAADAIFDARILLERPLKRREGSRY